jgi:hypothetical protein
MKQQNPTKNIRLPIASPEVILSVSFCLALCSLLYPPLTDTHPPLTDFWLKTACD